MRSEDYTRIEKLELDPFTQRMKGTAIHGNTPFDVPYITQLEENLFVGGCMDEMILPDNILHVISLYPWERYVAAHDLRSEHYFYAYDAGVPDEELIDQVCSVIDYCITDGPTLVHCQAGLNRSPFMVANYLCRWRGEGPQSSIDLLRAERSPAVLCNKNFERYLLEEFPTYED